VKTILLVILTLFFPFHSRGDEVKLIYQYRVLKSKVTGAEISALSNFGKSLKDQPILRTSILTVSDTNYYLLNVITNDAYEFGLLTNKVIEGKINLYQILEYRETYNPMVGVMEKYTPKVVVDNSDIYPIDHDWSVKVSS